MEKSKIMAVFRNECYQTLTPGRMVGWLLICGFPVLLVILIKQFGELPSHQTDRWVVVLFVVCEIICLLQLLIWATPWLHTELEGQSWTYLAVRPGGKTAVLVGKYLAAGARTMIGTEIALACSLLIAQPTDSVKVFLVLGTLVAISSFAYAAVFVFLGAVFPKRAMVLAVGYSLLVEFVISLVPAVINKASIQFRLRSLLVEWMQLLDVNGAWKSVRGFEQMLGDSPSWIHLLVLVSVALAELAIANQLVCRKEQLLSPE